MEGKNEGGERKEEGDKRRKKRRKSRRDGKVLTMVEKFDLQQSNLSLPTQVFHREYVLLTILIKIRLSVWLPSCNNFQCIHCNKFSRNLTSSHEEADPVIATHAMTRCQNHECVRVIPDDNDMFALLYFCFIKVHMSLVHELTTSGSGSSRCGSNS